MLTDEASVEISMLAKSSNERPAVFLVSSDTTLAVELEKILNPLGFRIEVAPSGMEAGAMDVIDALGSIQGLSAILLDAQTPDVASGRLLASLQESRVHRACPIACIADAVSDEWIARLREGMIDDIVPRNTEAAGWKAHLTTMQRGHALFSELEHMREATSLEIEHDRVTGVFNRGTMLSILFRETERVQRLRGALCLVLFTIDDLDFWAAEHGPEVADQLLREVAQRTGRQLRSYDVLGRMAHDQFLLALPGCSAIHAMMLSERLCFDVFAETFAVTGGPKSVVQARLTGSFAITASRGRSPLMVLREVEQTLAQGRKLGPGTIRCHGESPLAAESTARICQLFPEIELMTQ